MMTSSLKATAALVTLLVGSVVLAEPRELIGQQHTQPVLALASSAELVPLSERHCTTVSHRFQQYYYSLAAVHDDDLSPLAKTDLLRDYLKKHRVHECVKFLTDLTTPRRGGDDDDETTRK